MFFDCGSNFFLLGAERTPHGAADSAAGKPVGKPRSRRVNFHFQCCVELRGVGISADVGGHVVAEQGAFGLVEFDHRVNAARGDRDVLREGGVTRSDVGVCDLKHQGVDLAAFPRFKRS